MQIEKQEFGKSPDGKIVELYTLTNDQGMTAGIMNYGGTLVALMVPDKSGKVTDVVLGLDSFQEYLQDDKFLGVTVGRYANRIAAGKFRLNGVEYQLEKNDGENHLHGGSQGFYRVLWEAKPFSSATEVGLQLQHFSRHMDSGYPGNLDCTVIYKLTNNNELYIGYEVKTDQATPVNLTHHSYFNLAGEGNGNILDHELMLNAATYTPLGADGMVTGAIEPVADTPLDFTTAKPIGKDLESVPGGYDHNYVLNGKMGVLRLAAQVREPKTGRIMKVLTTKPGMQFYSGNFLTDADIGKGGKHYRKHFGFCLEPQYYPDSPNQPDFPSAILKPGELYHHEIVYSFTIE
jgi:aldose 1-epimerase